MISQEDAWVSLSEVARRTGKSLSSVSRRVAMLERDGLLSSRMEGAGAPKLVSLDAFLAAAGRTANVARSQSAAMGTPAREARRGEPQAAGSGGNGLVFADEQARKTRLQADLAQLQLDKARGLLVDVAEVTRAMEKAGGRLARGVDGIVQKADEWAALVGREGSAGLRTALKAYARELRERLAADMTADGAADDE